jgi:hypothetical protein
MYLFFSYSSPPQPAGCVTATPLLLLLWYPDCIGITNSSSVGTEPKEAAYAITGGNTEKSLSGQNDNFLLFGFN